MMIAVPAALLGAYLVFIGLKGRAVDSEAKRCRRCRYDVRDCRATRCPECGSDLLHPQSVVTGRRMRSARLIVIGALLLVLSLSAYGTKRVMQARGVTSLHFVSEERLMLRHLLETSEWGRREEVIEIERRYAAGTLSPASVAEFTELVMAGTAGRRSMPWIQPDAEEVRLASTMLLAPGYPPDARHDLFEQWLARQASVPVSRWSVVWGEAILEAHRSGLLTAEQFERFLRNGLEAEIFIDEKAPIQPGQRVWVAMRWNVKLGDSSWGSMRGISGVVSVPGLDEWCWAPQVGVRNGSPTRIGRITAPATPGEYDLHGTVGVSLSGGLHRLEKRIPTEKPDLTTVRGLDWAVPISCSYTVAEPEAAPDGAQP